MAFSKISKRLPLNKGSHTNQLATNGGGGIPQKPQHYTTAVKQKWLS